MKNLLIRIGKKSRKAFADQINTKKKNKVLKDFSKLIRQNKNKIIQLFGMISFSLYLFHQPIFVFYRIYSDRVSALNSFVLFSLIIFLLLISYINWKFVEIPFQKKFFK